MKVLMSIELIKEIPDEDFDFYEDTLEDYRKEIIECGDVDIRVLCDYEEE